MTKFHHPGYDTRDEYEMDSAAPQTGRPIRQSRVGTVLNTINDVVQGPPQRVSYRGYVIYYEPKPVPTRVIGSWSFHHEDYDGPGDNRAGWGASVEDCMAQINELEDEDLEAAADPDFGWQRQDDIREKVSADLDDDDGYGPDEERDA